MKNPPAPVAPAKWSKSRILFLVVGSISCLVGIVLIFGPW